MKLPLARIIAVMSAITIVAIHAAPVDTLTAVVGNRDFQDSPETLLAQQIERRMTPLDPSGFASYVSKAADVNVVSFAPESASSSSLHPTLNNNPLGALANQPESVHLPSSSTQRKAPPALSVQAERYRGHGAPRFKKPTKVISSRLRKEDAQILQDLHGTPFLKIEDKELREKVRALRVENHKLISAELNRVAKSAWSAEEREQDGLMKMRLRRKSGLTPVESKRLYELREKLGFQRLPEHWTEGSSHGVEQTDAVPGVSSRPSKLQDHQTIVRQLAVPHAITQASPSAVPAVPRAGQAKKVSELPRNGSAGKLFDVQPATPVTLDLTSALGRTSSISEPRSPTQAKEDAWLKLSLGHPPRRARDEPAPHAPHLNLDLSLALPGSQHRA